MPVPTTEFVREAWYVVALVDEFGSRPLRRVVCGDPYVLYRTGEGLPVALRDECAHRAFPLSAGEVRGERIRCRYHGFEFDPTGTCVLVPAQERIPKHLQIRALPLVERDGWVWAWLGDPDAADARRIPETWWLSSPDWASVRHMKRFGCRAALLHDNLLDLTHEAFIHEGSIGDEAVYTNDITVEVDGRTVIVDRHMPACDPSPLLSETTGVAAPVDRWHTTVFVAPSIHVIKAGIVDVGGDRADGYHWVVLNAITPESAYTSWYFYAYCRDFALDDGAVDERLKIGLDRVLEEDAEALALQETGLRGADPQRRDGLIGQDAGVSRGRRAIEALLERERLELER